MMIEKAFNFQNFADNVKGNIEEPSECPLCNYKIKPVENGIMLYRDDSGKYCLSVLYQCKHCYKAFVAFHSVETEAQTIHNITYRKFVSKLEYVGPKKFTPRVFDDRITQLSQKFVTVYNQALEAEAMDLTEIAGMGYRKALEFLVKDYLVSVQPEAKAEIEGMFLGDCIKEKVKNERIQAAAKASAWVGNDFTHYLRKYEDKDIHDLKTFIDATVYWVAMELITDEALHLPRQK